MTYDARTNVTNLLHRLRSPAADTPANWSRLYTVVYPELRRVAAAVMRAEAPGHVLQPTALVHEAYLKLVDRARVDWRDRAHFLGVAARAMRQVLVDHARRREAARRGGGWERVELGEAIGSGPDRALEIIELDDALRRLAEVSERMAQVVELRVFGGLSHESVAEVLHVSARTAAADWAVARRWLARELAGQRPS